MDWRSTTRMRSLAAGLLLLACSWVSAAEPLKISVIGGGGMIGQRVVREALDRGHHVTAIVRDPTRFTLAHERLTVRRGDVLDPQISDLLAGQDVVVSAIGSARAQKPDPTVYLKAAESLVTALRKLGQRAPRLIVVGGAGSLKNAAGQVLVERLPPQRQPEGLGQKAALDYYRTVEDVSWSYFSPAGSIMPGERTGVFRLGADTVIMAGERDSRISMEDYALALIDEAEKPRHVRRRFTIGY